MQSKQTNFINMLQSKIPTSYFLSKTLVKRVITSNQRKVDVLGDILQIKNAAFIH